MAFGLGAGVGFYYLALEDTSPSRWFNGRTPGWRRASAS